MPWSVQLDVANSLDHELGQDPRYLTWGILKETLIERYSGIGCGQKNARDPMNLMWISDSSWGDGL